jgi:hypothetical protein
MTNPAPAFIPARPPLILMGVVAALLGLLAQPLMLLLGCSPSLRQVEFLAAGGLAAGLILLGLIDRVIRATTSQKHALPAGYALAGALAALVAGGAVFAGIQTSRQEQSRSEEDSQTAAVINRFLEDLAQTGTQARQDYLGAMNAVGWNTLLNADRLAQDEDFTETKKILTEAEALVAKYAKQSSDNFDQTPVLARNLDIPERAKAEFITGWEQGAGATREKLQRVWALEKQVLGHFRDATALLADRDTWAPANGQIQFQEQEALDAFNTLMAKIQSDAAEQQEIQAELGVAPAVGK